MTQTPDESRSVVGSIGFIWMNKHFDETTKLRYLCIYTYDTDAFIARAVSATTSSSRPSRTSWST